MEQRISHALEQAQVPVGYGVTAVVGSSPVWVESLTSGLEIAAFVVAIIVGITTVRLNIIRTRAIKGSENK
jgi:hypothetical protein